MTADPTPTLSDADLRGIRVAACGCGDAYCLVAMDTDWGQVATEVAALIARERKSARGQALDEAAKALLLMAADRMDEHGPHDARGAAIWDCGVFLREQFDQST